MKVAIECAISIGGEIEDFKSAISLFTNLESLELVEINSKFKGKNQRGKKKKAPIKF